MASDAAPLSLLFHSSVTWALGGVALAILFTYWLGHRWNPRGAAIGLRVLAVMGLVLPGWRILTWYGELRRVRQWSDDFPATSDAVAETLLINSIGLLTLGFLIMIAGIYLARRLPTEVRSISRAEGS